MLRSTRVNFMLAGIVFLRVSVICNIQNQSISWAREFCRDGGCRLLMVRGLGRTLLPEGAPLASLLSGDGWRHQHNSSGLNSLLWNPTSPQPPFFGFVFRFRFVFCFRFVFVFVFVFIFVFVSFSFLFSFRFRFCSRFRFRFRFFVFVFRFRFSFSFLFSF